MAFIKCFGCKKYYPKYLLIEFARVLYFDYSNICGICLLAKCNFHYKRQDKSLSHRRFEIKRRYVIAYNNRMNKGKL